MTSIATTTTPAPVAKAPVAKETALPPLTAVDAKIPEPTEEQIIAIAKLHGFNLANPGARDMVIEFYYESIRMKRRMALNRRKLDQEKAKREARYLSLVSMVTGKAAAACLALTSFKATVTADRKDLPALPAHFTALATQANDVIEAMLACKAIADVVTERAEKRKSPTKKNGEGSSTAGKKTKKAKQTQTNNLARVAKGQQPVV